MCGLFGYLTTSYNGFNRDELNSTEQAMILNSLRGDDSTGIVCVNNKDKWFFRKKVGGPSHFLKDQACWGEMDRLLFNSGRLVFGHGRAATRGDISAANAHPFLVQRADKSHVLLVHNGTLSYHQSLPGFSDHDVDSKWLAQTLADLGPVDTFSQVNGAVATIWWDERDNSLNFYRNHDRPLWAAVLSNGSQVWNSEKDVLDFLAFKWKWKYKTEPYELAPYHWCKVVPNEKHDAWFNEKIERKIIMVPPAQGVQQGNFPILASSRRRKGGNKGSDGQVPRMTDLNIGNNEGINPYDDGSDDWMLVEGYIEFIEWTPERNQKHIKYMGGSHVMEDEAPPSPSLRKKYYRDQKREIVEVHEDDGRCRFIIRKVDDAVAALEEATTTVAIYDAMDEENESENCCLVLPFTPDAPKKVEEQKDSPFFADEVHDTDLKVTFRKGKPARWHTKGERGLLLRHFATSENTYPTFFTNYENDHDGKFFIGQDLELEYYYSEQLKDGPLKAFCSQLKTGPQEIAIDFVFQTDRWSKTDLKRMHFFKGNIQWIRVMHKEERKQQQISSSEYDGPIIQAYIANVEPLNAQGTTH